ncbi:MAG: GTPase Era [Desulfofustis sp.]|nr:GTPase Era [Desulfofustis sp.]
MDAFPAETVSSGMVALVGPPNAGKSTLLNTMLGQKISIVTPKPQTTRNRILGVLNGPDYQIVFLDTPGLHQSSGLLNREMVKIAMDSLKGMDAVLFILDASRVLPEAREQEQRRQYLDYFNEIDCPAVLLLNKVDLIDRRQLLPLIDSYARLYPFRAIMPVSALRGDGLPEIIDQLLPVLPRGVRYFPEDSLTDASERFLAAEIIREKVFLLTGQEIPYSSAVLIDSFKEDDERNRVTIHATIYLERPSQKPIVIGTGGAKLKQIGIAARKDIEELIGRHVLLKLWIKIKKHWTRDERFLKELGF